MSKKVKIIKKPEIDRQKLEISARRDSISLLKNLIRLFPREADEELQKLRKVRTQTV